MLCLPDARHYLHRKRLRRHKDRDGEWADSAKHPKQQCAKVSSSSTNAVTSSSSLAHFSFTLSWLTTLLKESRFNVFLRLTFYCTAESYNLLSRLCNCCCSIISKERAAPVYGLCHRTFLEIHFNNDAPQLIAHFICSITDNTTHL